MKVLLAVEKTTNYKACKYDDHTLNPFYEIPGMGDGTLFRLCFHPMPAWCVMRPSIYTE